MFARRRSRLAAPHRSRSTAPQRIEGAFAAFGRCLELVERAKASLVEASPGGRALGAPLAEALARFEEYVREARQAMPAWRTAELEEAWQSSSAALDESSRRAETLRLGQAPSGYEQLYTVLADLMEPLDAFGSALSRFRDLGV